MNLLTTNTWSWDGEAILNMELQEKSFVVAIRPNHVERGSTKFGMIPTK